MNYRVLIADDEDFARIRISRLLSECAKDFIVVAEAEDGKTAIELIEHHKPDLVFLDIQMPSFSGIDVALTTSHKPFVIFVTAFDQFALEAFKAPAVDYLLKPVEENDLRNALEKFKRFIRPVEDYNKLISTITDQKSAIRHKTVAVSTGNSVKLFFYDEIICLEADNKYTTVYTLKGEYITETSLAKFEKLLPNDLFIRIHRKHIVNFDYVDEIARWYDRRRKIKLTVPFKNELIVGKEYGDRIPGAL